MTAYGSIDIAVRAMKQGANDFVTKPFEPDMLTQLLHEVIESGRIIHRASTRDQRRIRKLISSNETMERVLQQARKVAAVDTSVLILGESGTGKELVARYIHENSPRADKPFIAVNCAAMPEDLLESEFFGHEAGAFTGATQTRIGVFELAKEGTIFLDEVGDMPAVMQVKLLRALQEREIKRVGGNKLIKVAPRILAATNKNIEECLEDGSMRDDFYYRIAVVSLKLTPLRERKDDVEELIDYFCDYFCSSLAKSSLTISKEARNLMLRYPWPGNARELENVIERAAILAEHTILPEHLGIDLSIDFESIEDTALSLPEIANRAARDAEMDLIQKTLRRTSGNKSKAAKALGVSYKTLLNKIKDYEISTEGMR